MSQDKRPQSSDIIDLLNLGQIEIIGRMPYSSNGTYLVQVTLEDRATKAIYKPHQGERTLWDFPDGLYAREVAAYELSQALNWDLVPPTVLRGDAPLGIGSLQLFIEADFSEHYFSLFEREELHPQFMKFALFDIIANNADRKSGHLLIDENDHIWGIDQGLCFHSIYKLRTVIWEFAGLKIPDDLITRVRESIPLLIKSTRNLLTAEESAALELRITSILKKKKFPIPDSEMRCYPWPLV